MGRSGDSNVVTRKENRREEDNKVNQVSHTAELGVNADHADSHSFLWFESRKEIFDKIMESFQDDNIPGVVLWGMGGAGKTTFAKQLGKRAYDLKMFKLVVFVPAEEGRMPYVEKFIQGSIAKQLGLMTSREDDSNLIGSRIWRRLSKHQPVLVILDDLLIPVKLEEIGIWNSHSRTGCKVLITSRLQTVGHSIGIECVFHLYLLTDSEGFDLLRKRAGLVHGSPNHITDVAMRVARKCEGIPLLLSLVGSALSGKNMHQWEQLLNLLNDIHMDAADTMNFYRILNWIIDFSTSSVNAAAKTLFSICSFFPRDQEISVEDLSLYAVKLGLCSKHEAIATINSLKKSGLLMQADQSSDHVIIHGLFHDAALRLIHKQKDAYFDSIQEYFDELHHNEDFQWKQELQVLLIQLYGVTEHNPSSSSFSGDPGLQILPSNPYIASSRAATIPKPSGKMVNFKEGGCVVDKSFLLLLKEACKENPQLLGSQRTHSEFLRQTAFDNLGKLLFLLHNVVLKDWVHHKQELQLFWEQTLAMKFDLDWLKPTIERISSSPEFTRIEALREEERQLNEEAAKLRQMLEVVENKAAVIRTKIEREESMLNGFAIAHVSKARLVSKANTSLLRRIFATK